MVSSVRMVDRVSSRGPENSRSRILGAAWEILHEAADPSMAAIAARAGLSRQAVYLHFNSRTELLMAVADWANDEVGLNARVAWVQNAGTARAMLRRFIEVAVWHVHVNGAGILALQRVVEADPELTAHWRTRSGRPALAGRITAGLADERQLRRGVSPTDGAVLLESLTRSIVVNDLLVAGLGESATVRLLHRAVIGAICRLGDGS